MNYLTKMLNLKDLKYRISNSIVSSVATFSKNEEEKIIEMINPIILNHETKVPFENKYDTPKTLGVDRIALAAAAVSKFPEKNTLVIDAGTCITFDFITKDKKYCTNKEIEESILTEKSHFSEFPKKFTVVEILPNPSPFSF